MNFVFFENPTTEVAQKLLGCEIAVNGVVARIVETEAYLGREDAASHAACGPTDRNRGMFGPCGVLYVYLSYGVHHCLNIVAHPPGGVGAVLIRAVEPLDGWDLVQKRRSLKSRKKADLCNGPGKLCQALAIDLDYDGEPIGKRIQWQEASRHPEESISSGPRVGISKAKDLPYRYWIEDNPFVGRARP